MKRNERIRERRKALHMTAEELGEKIGRDRATVYRYESGRFQKMDIEILKKIAAALGTSAAYLNGETDDPDSRVWDRPLRDDPLVLTAEEEDLIRKLRALPDDGRRDILRILEIAYSAYMRHVVEEDSDDAGI